MYLLFLDSLFAGQNSTMGRGMYSVVALACITYNIVITSPNGNGVISHLPNLPNFDALCFYTSNSDHVIRCYNMFLAIIYSTCPLLYLHVIYPVRNFKTRILNLNFCRNLMALILALLQMLHSTLCVAPRETRLDPRFTSSFYVYKCYIYTYIKVNVWLLYYNLRFCI